jgi:hypothetical protein
MNVEIQLFLLSDSLQKFIESQFGGFIFFNFTFIFALFSSPNGDDTFKHELIP